MSDAKEKGPGKGVDAQGGPVVDPTENVKELNKASTARLDDLRVYSERYTDAQIRNLEKRMEIQSDHQKELDQAESQRINSIRQVDREDVAKTAASANTAIATLASQNNTTAETLRTQVANVAQAVESRQSAFASDVNKRLSALELSSSEGKGKQTVADPQMERLSAVVEKLASRESVSTGKGEGLSAGWKILIAVVGLIGSLLVIGSALVAVVLFLNKPDKTAAAPVAPQIVYVPVSPTATPNAAPEKKQ